MKEITEIVRAYSEADKLGKKTALATVVLVEGSAYRRPGARMLITEDGEITGAISGGCLEGDALRKARLVIMQQEAMLVTYDTMDDDDAKFGVGLGCNGIIHILIEPITHEKYNPIQLLKAVMDNRVSAVLVTLFSISDKKAFQPGTCLSLSEQGITQQDTTVAASIPTLIADAEHVFSSGRSETKVYDNVVTYTAFVEYLRPAISLVIVGAGNDAIPLTNIAALLGWDITVADGRPNLASVQRFPNANKVITIRANELLTQVAFNEQTAFVLMTHNYIYELELLKGLMPLNPAYVGVLGPRKKLERMLGELEDGGLALTDPQLGNVFGPVGLDIGSEGAEEIALSIVAEIKAVFSSRNGKSLKYKSVPIHAVSLADDK